MRLSVAAESRIFDLINAERRHQGLAALTYNPRLDRMAKIQAQNMARLQKMAHVLPDVGETGIAIAKSSAGGLYYCQVFGRQLQSL